MADKEGPQSEAQDAENEVLNMIELEKMLAPLKPKGPRRRNMNYPFDGDDFI